jgi:hypothetical protein
MEPTDSGILRVSTCSSPTNSRGSGGRSRGSTVCNPALWWGCTAWVSALGWCGRGMQRACIIICHTAWMSTPSPFHALYSLRPHRTHTHAPHMNIHTRARTHTHTCTHAHTHTHTHITHKHEPARRDCAVYGVRCGVGARTTRLWTRFNK